jgi:hypothetical protein
MSDRSLTFERLVILTALRRGVLLARARYVTLLMIGLPPLLLLLAASACDVLIQAQAAAGALPGVTALLLFAVLAVRLFAVGMLCAGWTWYCGAAMIEAQPDAAEAMQMGWQYALRCVLACLPVWMIGLALVAMALMVGRALLLLFAPAGWPATLLIVLLLASCLVLPLVALLARFCMLVPVTLFDAAQPFEALGRSGAYLPWRLVYDHWWPVCCVGAAVLLGVFVPACLLTPVLWALVGADNLALPLALLRHALAAGALWLAGPCAFVLIAPLYFAQRPDLFTAETTPS